MDADWKLFRSEVPHLAEPPSFYFKRNLRLSSQPIEEPPNVQQLIDAWSLVEADKIVLFSSDYPHFDADDPFRAFPRLPAELTRKIQYENAKSWYRL
jgi:predicted TIM-barrel fold metal-dependent hydrolase